MSQRTGSQPPHMLSLTDYTSIHNHICTRTPAQSPHKSAVKIHGCQNPVGGSPCLIYVSLHQGDNCQAFKLKSRFEFGGGTASRVERKASPSLGPRVRREREGRKGNYQCHWREKSQSVPCQKWLLPANDFLWQTVNKAERWQTGGISP